MGAEALGARRGADRRRGGMRRRDLVVSPSLVIQSDVVTANCCCLKPGVEIHGEGTTMNERAGRHVHATKIHNRALESRGVHPITAGLLITSKGTTGVFSRVLLCFFLKKKDPAEAPTSHGARDHTIARTTAVKQAVTYLSYV